MKRDEILRCSECSGEVGMLRIVKGYAMLGHLRQPDPIHPVRLARGEQQSSAAQVASRAMASAARPTEPDLRRGAEVPTARGAIVPATRPHPRSRSRSSGGTSSPAGKARRSRTPPGSGSALSTGALDRSYTAGD